jgi:hypothetical protein
LVQDCGGAEFQTAGNLLVVEDLKRGTNKDIGPKDIFEMTSKITSSLPRKMKPNHRIYAKIGLIGYSLLVNPSNRARSVLFRQYQQPLTINVLIEPFCSIRTLGLKFFAAKPI